MIKVCRWYVVCPIKRFCEEGKLDWMWVETYCKGDYRSCVRYEMEEAGKPHPNNMLPDGSIRESLK
ncbi:MAG: uracil-DNA glycosylase [Candidatus Altiarchaeota archaeon]|nr:uracil-DNA glycosylase [Candidatus Altiarchaeota archaeon]